MRYSYRMKSKTVKLLLALVLFLSSGLFISEFMSRDYYNCMLENIGDSQSDLATVSIQKACESKFPGDYYSGPWSVFGPWNYGDCLLKYSKG